MTTSAPLVGGFVTPTNVRPYMKPRPVAVRFTGLRPNVNLYVFFNDINISEYCRQFSLQSSGAISDDSTWLIQGEIGDQIVSDSAGEVCLEFFVPAAVFLVGSGVIVIKDSTGSDYTTRGEVTYNSFNFPVAPNESYNTRLVLADNTQKDRETAGKTQITGGFVNPFSWTFRVTPNMARGKEGIYVTGVDLYFSKKDATFGCVVEVRDVEGELPKSSHLPLSRIHLRSADIATSGATAVTFPGLTFLAAGRDYAISLIPDGGASNYAVHTAKVGSRDTATNSTISKDWEGKMYLPTNGTSWNAIQNEYPKFNLKYAQFSANSGWGQLVNKNYEFLTLSSPVGNFLPGEMVAKNSANLTGTVAVSNSSYEITGSSTNFTSSFNNGDFAVFVNSLGSIDICRIDAVTNATHMTLKKKPKFTDGLASIQKTPVGRVDAWNEWGDSLTLINSTAANSLFLFAGSDTIRGAQSNATATVSAIANKQINMFQPLFSTTVVAETELRLNSKIIGSDYSTPAETQTMIGNNLIADRSAIVASRSNEILYYAGGKSLSMNVQFSSSANTLSPLLDMAIPTIITYGNRVNNLNTNEHTRSGSALSKYISKPVVLKDGLDSEDIKVILAAYRPPGVTIDVYVKFQNSSDPAPFDDKNWTQLYGTNPNIYSSSVNENDVLDFEYYLPGTPPIGTLQTGAISLSTASATATGTGTLFTSAVANGDLIYITNDSSSQIRKVISVTNNTSMVLEGNSYWTALGARYYPITIPNAAYKDNQVDMLKYYGTDGVAYFTYKTFAIKIVFLSQFTYARPYVDNIRVVAST